LNFQFQNLEGGSGNKNVLSKKKLFTKLARNSTNNADQFKAYNSAIELLKKKFLNSGQI
jgi:hypothetical protein